MKKTLITTAVMLSCLLCQARERETIWPKNRMPDYQEHQIAAMTDETSKEGFKPEKHRVAYLEWFEAPAPEVDNDACLILISGGSYMNCCDVDCIKYWSEEMTKLGFQCVNFVYRTPRPEGLPIYQSAWEDGQRAVRKVRSEAAKRGFDPEKIGTISMSAGSHLALMLATSSQTAAYERVDALDDIPCHINWAIVNAPAYVTTDGETGTPSTRQGYGVDVELSDCFKFDEKTCPMSLHHGGLDPYSPNGSTVVYRKLRSMGIPAELHLFPGKGHGAFGLERGVEFMRQMGFMGELAPQEKLMDRFISDESRSSCIRQELWPEGLMPDRQEGQETPYLEWHFPKELKTKAIQIVYSGGGYNENYPDGFEVAPVRRYLNGLGMTVVTMKYRTPRPEGLAKHTSAWQDLQRCIRVVRSQAAGYGLDPDNIGIMGSSAGGHLTLLGVTSSLHNSYWPVDGIDNLSCKVQWGIGIYPAYVLSDIEKEIVAPEFSFDVNTSPMLFLHGDADVHTAMGSVVAWEKMRAIGVQSELHTLSTRGHCFQWEASPGTASYNWMDRIRDFLSLP